jgi:hypothetical protein
MVVGVAVDTRSKLMTSLLPCPLCGNQAKLDSIEGDCGLYGPGITGYRIHCTKCLLEIERAKKSTVIRAWNQRIST